MIEIWTEFLRFNKKRQRLTEQTWMTLKEGCFSDLDIQENTDIQVLRNLNINQNTTDLNTTKQMFTKEYRINVELIKKFMSEIKTTLPSLRGKKVKVEAEKVNY